MALPRNDLIRFIEDADRTSEEELLSLFAPSQPEQPVTQPTGPNIDPALLAQRNAVTDASDAAAFNPDFFSASAMEDYFAKNPIDLGPNFMRNTFGGFDLNGGLKLNSPEEQKRLDDLDAIYDPLVKQILGQNLTKQWTGQGFGSPEANARSMAEFMASAGIRDIKDFGKVTKYEPALVIGQTFNGRSVQNPSPGVYYQQIPEYDSENGTTYRRQDLTPQEAEQVKTVYGKIDGSDADGNPLYSAIPESSVVMRDGVPMFANGTTLGNKATGQPIKNTFSAQGGENVFGGTTEGSGNTGYRVHFGDDGTPYFFTTYATSNDFAKILNDLGPIAQIAIAVATAGMSIPAQIATQAGIQLLAGADPADIAKNVAVSMVVSNIPGSDFMKETTKTIKDMGLDPSVTKVLTNSVQTAASSAVRAAITGQDIGDAVLAGAASGGINGAINVMMNTPDIKELTKDLSATQKRMVETAISGVISGKPLDQAIINAAIAGASAEAREQAKYKPLTDAQIADLTPEEKAAYDDKGPRGLKLYQDEVKAANRALKNLNSLTNSGRTGDDMGGGNDTVSSAGADTLPSGTQLAAVDSGTVSDAGNGLNIQAGGEDTLTAAIDNLLSNPQLKADEDLFKSGQGTLDTVTSGAGNDVVDNLVNAGLKETSTGDQVDSIVGATGNDTLAGADGNDTVSSAGTDTVVAGTGNDSVSASTGADTSAGGAGEDTSGGESGVDTVDVVAKPEYELAGFPDEETYLAFGKNKAIYDIFDGNADAYATAKSAGELALQMAVGNADKDMRYDVNDDGKINSRDALLISKGEPLRTDIDALGALIGGTDTVVAGAGNDTIAGSSSDPYFGLTQEQYDQLMGVGGNPESGTGSTVTDGANEGGEGGDITIGGGEDTVVDGSGEDTIDYGDDDLNELLNGTVAGGDTNDTIAGEGGTDTSTTDVDTVDVVDGTGNDTMSDDEINDFIDNLIGGFGNDTVDSGLSNNDILNLINAESLIGGGTNDSISGGTTNDELVITGGTGNDSIEAGTGNDVVGGTTLTPAELESLRLQNLLSAGATGTEVLTGGDTNDTVVVTGGAGNDAVGGDSTGDAELTPEELESLRLLNLISAGAGGTDTLAGGTGNDNVIVTGAAGNDSVVGGDTNDSVTGGDTNDSIVGGLGNSLIGGTGNDNLIITGEKGTGTGSTGGQDTCPVGTIYNPVTGQCDAYWDETGSGTGEGTDEGTVTVVGSRGNDVITGGEGNDSIEGGLGNSSIGGTDHGTVVITGGRETCPAGTRLNEATGNCDPYWDETGTDTTTGGTGNDTVQGGTGNDTTAGGGGGLRLNFDPVQALGEFYNPFTYQAPKTPSQTDTGPIQLMTDLFGTDISKAKKTGARGYELDLAKGGDIDELLRILRSKI